MSMVKLRLALIGLTMLWTMLGSSFRMMAAAPPVVTSISSRGNPTGITINWSTAVSATGTNPAN